MPRIRIGRVLLAVAGVGLLAAGVSMFLMRESYACGSYRSRVTARLLDAETRAPLAGAVVVALWELSDADDTGLLAQAREEHRAATSDGDGRIDFHVSAGYCHHVKRDGFWRVKDVGAPYPGYGVAGLVAQTPGYRRLVLATPRERWTGVEPRDVFDPAAVLDVGELLLSRE